MHAPEKAPGRKQRSMAKPWEKISASFIPRRFEITMISFKV
tara:strand:- start:2804 stop:2926 length:123 start_codon:yes stop_codon:yes gene_type:complete